jgi:hypothetical protein
MADETSSADQHFIVAHEGKLHVMTSLACLDPNDPNATAEENATTAWMTSQLGGGTVKLIDSAATATAPKPSIEYTRK